MNYECENNSWWSESTEFSNLRRSLKLQSCQLRGLGGYLPSRVLKNEELARTLGVSEEWIFSRTGIKERHILEQGQNTSDLALHAALEALSDSGLAPGEITHLLLGSCSPDGLVPNTACTLERKLGLTGLVALDFNVACSGFLYGLYLAGAILNLEPEAKVLLVAAEAMSRICDWRDQNVSILFGDGAGAAVLTGGGSEGMTIEDIFLSSDGGPGELLTAHGGGSRAAYHSPEASVGEGYFLHMQGREDFKHAVKRMTEACRTILERNGLTPDDIDLFVPHQANLRIIEAVGEKLGFPAEKVVLHLEHCGNTSAATIPLALAHCKKMGLMRPGLRILTAAFGAGFTWGSALLKT